jgi:hypothetical protein
LLDGAANGRVLVKPASLAVFLKRSLESSPNIQGMSRIK